MHKGRQVVKPTGGWGIAVTRVNVRTVLWLCPLPDLQGPQPSPTGLLRLRAAVAAGSPRDDFIRLCGSNVTCATRRQRVCVIITGGQESQPLISPSKALRFAFYFQV